MSDLAKKCADKVREGSVTVDQAIGYGAANALAAFIEAAQECRDYLDGFAELNEDAKRYDAALRALAQSMEVSDD